jgi:hypothetical protein
MCHSNSAKDLHEQRLARRPGCSNSANHPPLHSSRERILIQAVNYAPELIGCAKYTTELAVFLAERGHRVEVVTAPPHYPGWYVREPYSAFSYASETLGRVDEFD